jgi:hypothetical protein
LRRADDAARNPRPLDQLEDVQTRIRAESGDAVFQREVMNWVGMRVRVEGQVFISQRLHHLPFARRRAMEHHDPLPPVEDPGVVGIDVFLVEPPRQDPVALHVRGAETDEAISL